MEGGAKKSYVQKMFSSHPETQARIDHITKRAEKDGYERAAGDGLHTETVTVERLYSKTFHRTKRVGRRYTTTGEHLSHLSTQKRVF